MKELESLDAAFIIDTFLLLLIGIGPKIGRSFRDVVWNGPRTGADEDLLAALPGWLRSGWRGSLLSTL